MHAWNEAGLWDALVFAFTAFPNPRCNAGPRSNADPKLLNPTPRQQRELAACAEDWYWLISDANRQIHDFYAHHNNRESPNVHCYEMITAGFQILGGLDADGIQRTVEAQHELFAARIREATQPDLDLDLNTDSSPTLVLSRTLTLTLTRIGGDGGDLGAHGRVSQCGR